MYINAMRSSSYANFDFCQQQYFLTYVLGIERKAGLKADKGTAVHKILEILARIKIAIQNKQDKIIIEENQQELIIDTKKLLEPQTLTSAQIEKINRTRINKYNYKHPCQLRDGHTRYGVDLVEKIINIVYEYYSKNTAHDWKPVDYADITNWAWMALDYSNGLFDPRRRTIVEVEKRFNFVINKPWAKFDYTINGKTISGNLAINGTIDLITRPDDLTLEICDWKTGQRLNWATGQEKTYASLQNDFQLLLYYYACRKLFPKIPCIMITIFFVRDGGPFTLCFDDAAIDKTEQLIKSRFNEILKCNRPKMVSVDQKDFRCTKICDYYKMVSPNKDTNLCKFINNEIYNIGIDKVVDLYSNKDFALGQYDAPGEL